MGSGRPEREGNREGERGRERGKCGREREHERYESNRVPQLNAKHMRASLLCFALSSSFIAPQFAVAFRMFTFALCFGFPPFCTPLLLAWRR